MINASFPTRLTTTLELTAFMTDVSPLNSLYFESQPGQVEVAFYLPNPPILPNGVSSPWQVNTETAIDELIAINGNHWRKIFTIMAKLCASHSPSTQAWRALRAKLFVDTRRDALSVSEFSTSALSINALSTSALSRRLHFLSDAHKSCDQLAHIKRAPKLDPKAKWHIVCGLEAQTRLGITHTNQNRNLDEQGKIKFLPVADNKRWQDHGTVLLTPYLDYRQFPNHLIEQVHTLLHLSNE
jgi:hypothetical protein